MKFKSLLLIVSFIPTMAQAEVIALPAGSKVGGVKPDVAPLVAKPTPAQPKPTVEIGLQKGLPPTNPIAAVGYGASNVGLTTPTGTSITWAPSSTATKPR